MWVYFFTLKQLNAFWLGLMKNSRKINGFCRTPSEPAKRSYYVTFCNTHSTSYIMYDTTNSHINIDRWLHYDNLTKRPCHSKEKIWISSIVWWKKSYSEFDKVVQGVFMNAKKVQPLRSWFSSSRTLWMYVYLLILNVPRPHCLRLEV